MVDVPSDGLAWDVPFTGRRGNSRTDPAAARTQCTAHAPHRAARAAPRDSIHIYSIRSVRGGPGVLPHLRASPASAKPRQCFPWCPAADGRSPRSAARYPGGGAQPVPHQWHSAMYLAAAAGALRNAIFASSQVISPLPSALLMSHGGAFLAQAAVGHRACVGGRFLVARDLDARQSRTAARLSLAARLLSARWGCERQGGTGVREGWSLHAVRSRAGAWERLAIAVGNGRS
jgi:hypothetical protein